MKLMPLLLFLLLTGCLGDRIPWDIAEVKQSDGAVCIYVPNIGKNFVYERVKIQKSGEKEEFTSDFKEKTQAKNTCLPAVNYKFLPGNEYNVSFSVIDMNSRERKVYAANFTDK